jgi:hypothetical protein
MNIKVKIVGLGTMEEDKDCIFCKSPLKIYFENK